MSAIAVFIHQLKSCCFLRLCSLLILLLLGACAATGEQQASKEYLSVSGWQSVDDAFQSKNFRDYSAAIKNEVQLHRISFDPARRQLEVDRVSPAEYPPDPSCEKEAGIAVVVHGLSDTAFSMSDIASVFAKNCFRARTVLLPGHGTRSGDLLNVRLQHWQDTVSYLLRQAADEHETIVAVGMSMGAVLTLDAALRPENSVDAIVSIAPAFHLSTWRLARLTPWVVALKPWIDKGIADDAMRYEAMPTRGVAETARAIKSLHGNLQQVDTISIPWMVIQSVEDAVIVPEKIQQLFQTKAAHPASRLLNFHAKAPDGSNISVAAGEQGEDWFLADDDERIIAVNSFSERYRSYGITHVAVHLSPLNPHYGFEGEYRNCGSTAPRDSDEVKRCQSAEEVWYGPWGVKAPDDRPAAVSTFNPEFDQLAGELGDFLSDLTVAND